MATYCYQCDECYETFESRASMARADKFSKGHRVTCPNCGSLNIRHKSSPAEESQIPVDQECDVSPQDFKTLKIQSTPLDIADVRSEIVAAAIERMYSKSEVFALTLGLSEALTNAYVHGNRQEPERRITVEYCVADNEATIRVIDEGQGFDPALVPDPTDAQHIELSHGRGILLMQSLLDEVRFCRRGTCVRLIKHHGKAGAAETAAKNLQDRGGRP